MDEGVHASFGTSFWGIDRDTLAASTLSLFARAKHSLAVVETTSTQLGPWSGNMNGLTCARTGTGGSLGRELFAAAAARPDSAFVLAAAIQTADFRHVIDSDTRTDAARSGPVGAQCQCVGRQ